MKTLVYVKHINRPKQEPEQPVQEVKKDGPEIPAFIERWQADKAKRKEVKGNV